MLAPDVGSEPGVWHPASVDVPQLRASYSSVPVKSPVLPRPPMPATPPAAADPGQLLQARGAPILAEYLGGAVTCDAYHMTDPRADGLGVSTCIKRAIEEAGIEREQVMRAGACTCRLQVCRAGRAGGAE